MSDKDEILYDEALTPTSSHSSPRHHFKMDRRWWLQLLPFLVLLGVLLSTILPLNQIQSHHTSYTMLYNDTTPKTADTLSIAVILTSVNTDTNQLMAMAYFDGALPSKITATDNAQKLSTTLNLNMGSASVALNPSTTNLWAPILESIPLTSGSITMFPLDEYTAPILVQATALLSANATTPYRFPVHLSVYTKGDFNWKYQVEPSATASFTPLLGTTSPDGQLSVRAYRHPLFFSYVGIMWLGIWIVTMCLLYIASVTIIWHRKPVDNPMIYFSGLIAVPLFRNTCPGKAPYGCLFDITSTYISLTVVFASMLIASFLSMARKKS